MKLTVKRTELLRAVRLARQLTSLPNQATNYFYLHAAESGLTVYACADNYVCIPVESDVLAEGTCAVERGRFIRILELLSDDTLRLTWANGSLNLNEQVHLPCRESGLEVQGLVQPNLSVDFTTLRRAIERVLPHVYKDEAVRPALAQVKNEVQNGVWRMVGCNGFVLSLVSMVFTDWEGEFLLPYRGLQRMASYKAKGEAKFAVGEDAVYWTLPGGVNVLINRGLEKYPNYESILPKQHTTRIQVNRDQLTRHLSMAQLFGQTICLSIQPDILTLYTHDKTDGHYCNSMPIVVEGEPLDIWFDPNLLKQALVGDTIEFTAPTKPCVVRGEDCEAVVMPQSAPR